MNGERLGQLEERYSDSKLSHMRYATQARHFLSQGLVRAIKSRPRRRDGSPPRWTTTERCAVRDMAAFLSTTVCRPLPWKQQSQSFNKKVNHRSFQCRSSLTSVVEDASSSAAALQQTMAEGTQFVQSRLEAVTAASNGILSASDLQLVSRHID